MFTWSIFDVYCLLFFVEQSTAVAEDIHTYVWVSSELDFGWRILSLFFLYDLPIKFYSNIYFYFYSYYYILGVTFNPWLDPILPYHYSFHSKLLLLIHIHSFNPYSIWRKLNWFSSCDCSETWTSKHRVQYRGNSDDGSIQISRRWKCN